MPLREHLVIVLWMENDNPIMFTKTNINVNSGYHYIHFLVLLAQEHQISGEMQKQQNLYHVLLSVHGNLAALRFWMDLSFLCKI